MLKTIVSSLVLLLVIFSPVGCAMTNHEKSQDLSENTFLKFWEEECIEIHAEKTVKKVDNFIVIFDPSASMNELYNGFTKFDIAKHILTNINRSIPDFEFKAGLRSFGSPVITSLIHGIQSYKKKAFSLSIDNIIKADGVSPLEIALDETIKDFDRLSGESAVLIISDGKNMDISPVNAAKKLQNEYQDKLCIYTVLIGDDPEGKKILSDISKAGDCGLATSADNLLTCEDINAFVKTIFCRSDRDGDGVPDEEDGCPDNPEKTAPGICGCDVPDTDNDHDGVPDCKDKCPDTPAGMEVDEKGCENIIVSSDVLFDFDKYELKDRAFPILDKISAMLEKDPNLLLEINGHTDNVGSAAYNLDLSLKRANAGRTYLIGKGPYAERIIAKGYGLSQPKVLNDTPEGRSKNRRIEFRFSRR